MAVTCQRSSQRIGQRRDIAREIGHRAVHTQENFDGIGGAQAGREVGIEEGKAGCSRRVLGTEEQRLQLPEGEDPGGTIASARGEPGGVSLVPSVELVLYLHLDRLRILEEHK